MDNREEAKQLHETLSLLGLRAQATAVGLVQLTSELLRAGVLDDDAVSRIKEAIARDIIVGRTATRGGKEFEEALRRRLDAVFPNKDEMEGQDRPIGASDQLGSSLSGYRDDAREERPAAGPAR